MLLETWMDLIKFLLNSWVISIEVKHLLVLCMRYSLIHPRCSSFSFDLLLAIFNWFVEFMWRCFLKLLSILNVNIDEILIFEEIDLTLHLLKIERKTTHHFIFLLKQSLLSKSWHWDRMNSCKHSYYHYCH